MLISKEVKSNQKNMELFFSRINRAEIDNKDNSMMNINKFNLFIQSMYNYLIGESIFGLEMCVQSQHYYQTSEPFQFFKRDIDKNPYLEVPWVFIENMIEANKANRAAVKSLFDILSKNNNKIDELKEFLLEKKNISWILYMFIQNPYVKDMLRIKVIPFRILDNYFINDLYNLCNIKQSTTNLDYDHVVENKDNRYILQYMQSIDKQLGYIGEVNKTAPRHTNFPNFQLYDTNSIAKQFDQRLNLSKWNSSTILSFDNYPIQFEIPRTAL
jgi:hypothetical protein